MSADLAPDFLGPILLGGFFQAISVGLILSQSHTFFKQSTDGSLLKALVTFVTFVACLESAFTGVSWWRLFVDNFDNPDAMMDLFWPDKIQGLIISLMSGPVHLYFAYRCYKATSRRIVVAIYLYFLIIGTFVTSIFSSYDYFQLFSADDKWTNSKNKVALDKAILLWMGCALVLDVSITVILLVFLVRTRLKSTSQNLRRTINTLMRLLWASATPPCVCAIAVCLSYLFTIVLGNISYWSLLPLDLLGPFYVLSLLITLNSRGEVSDSHHSGGRSEDQGPTRRRHHPSRRTVEARGDIVLELPPSCSLEVETLGASEQSKSASTGKSRQSKTVSYVTDGGQMYKQQTPSPDSTDDDTYVHHAGHRNLYPV